jgi:hypothetical protein
MSRSHVDTQVVRTSVNLPEKCVRCSVSQIVTAVPLESRREAFRVVMVRQPRLDHSPSPSSQNAHSPPVQDWSHGSALER